MSAAAVVLAGGSGTRLQRDENKVYLDLGGRPLLAWSLAAFERHGAIDRIVVVVRAGDERHAQASIAAAGATKVTHVVHGGSTRQESERAALDALATDIDTGEIELVLVHDAARPFLRQPLLTTIVHAARTVGGAVPAIPIETGILLRAEPSTGSILPVPTEDLRRVQTPQAFRAAPLLAAYRTAAEHGFHGADTAGSVERFSDLEIVLVPGDADNLKVTYADDLLLAEELATTWAPDVGP